MHSLARATGSKKRAGQGGWQKQYGRKLALYYANFANEKAEDRDAIEAELENILAAARLAFEYREWEALWRMGYALDDPLDYAGRWTAREELLRLCYEGAAKARSKEARAATPGRAEPTYPPGRQASRHRYAASGSTGWALRVCPRLSLRARAGFLRGASHPWPPTQEGQESIATHGRHSTTIHAD